MKNQKNNALHTKKGTKVLMGSQTEVKQAKYILKTKARCCNPK